MRQDCSYLMTNKQLEELINRARLPSNHRSVNSNQQLPDNRSLAEVSNLWEEIASERMEDNQPQALQIVPSIIIEEEGSSLVNISCLSSSSPWQTASSRLPRISGRPGSVRVKRKFFRFKPELIERYRRDEQKRRDIEFWLDNQCMPRNIDGQRKMSINSPASFQSGETIDENANFPAYCHSSTSEIPPPEGSVTITKYDEIKRIEAQSNKKLHILSTNQQLRGAESESADIAETSSKVNVLPPKKRKWYSINDVVWNDELAQRRRDESNLNQANIQSSFQNEKERKIENCSEKVAGIAVEERVNDKTEDNTAENKNGGGRVGPSNVEEVVAENATEGMVNEGVDANNDAKGKLHDVKEANIEVDEEDMKIEDGAVRDCGITKKRRQQLVCSQKFC